MQTRSLTMLDQTGDTTIVWDEDTEDQMIAIIQRFMDQGHVFYIVKPNIIPLMPARQVKAKKITDVRTAGSVIVRDEGLEKLFSQGLIATTTASADNDIQPVRKAVSANDVAANHSVSTKAQRGG